MAGIRLATFGISLRTQHHEKRLRMPCILAASVVCALLGGCAAPGLIGERKFEDVGVAGLAPDAQEVQEAVVQIYSARSYESFSRIFTVHTWIAFKEEKKPKYTVLEAHGWSPYKTGNAVRKCDKRWPDRRWHGAEPVLLFELRGTRARTAIPKILAALEQYPDVYNLWPGANSNSFIASIARAVPELAPDLPPTAIGKEFLVKSHILSVPPSGRGMQLSLFGVLGIIIALEHMPRVSPPNAIRQHERHRHGVTAPLSAHKRRQRDGFQPCGVGT